MPQYWIQPRNSVRIAEKKLNNILFLAGLSFFFYLFIFLYYKGFPHVQQYVCPDSVLAPHVEHIGDDLRLPRVILLVRVLALPLFII